MTLEVNSLGILKWHHLSWKYLEQYFVYRDCSFDFIVVKNLCLVFVKKKTLCPFVDLKRGFLEFLQFYIKQTTPSKRLSINRELPLFYDLTTKETLLTKTTLDDILIPLSFPVTSPLNCEGRVTLTWLYRLLNGKTICELLFDLGGPVMTKKFFFRTSTCYV